MRDDQPFEAGETVYAWHDAKAYTIALRSADGGLAFGPGPYNSGSFTFEYRFTHDKAAAEANSLFTARAEVRYLQRTIDDAQTRLAEYAARIVQLETLGVVARDRHGLN